MSFDAGKTLDLVKTGLTDPKGAWQKYFSEPTSWQETVQLLTGPIIVVSALLTAIFSSIFGGFGGSLQGSGFWSGLFTGLIMPTLGVIVSAGVFSFLGGTFGGQQNFSKALAAVSLAWIPAFLGGIVAAIIPFLGALVALAGLVLSLVYLYKLIPLALGVPDTKRVLHFILGLVIIIVINLILGSVFGLGRSAEQAVYNAGSTSGQAAGETRGSGMFGEMQRYGEVVENAGEHRFDPPSNGKVSKAQVAAYIDVQRKAKKAQERFEKQVKDLESDMNKDEKPSLASLSKIGASITGALGAQNAEMELVVTGGGNWAEHNWVKGQLQAALLHGGEGNATIEHNYKLFKPHLEELGL